MNRGSISSQVFIGISMLLSMAAIAISIGWVVVPRIDKVDFFSVGGTVVTATGLLVGTYFSVLAVSAYAHVRDIGAIYGDVERKRERIEAVVKRLDGIASSFSVTLSISIKMVDDFVSRQIKVYTIMGNIVGRGTESAEEIRRHYVEALNELERMRSRLAVGYKKYERKDMWQRVAGLLEYGKKGDIQLLSELIGDKEASEDIRRLAAAVGKRLEAKFHK